MARRWVVSVLVPTAVAEVIDLVDRVTHRRGLRPVNDHSWLALTAGTATGVDGRDADGRLVGWAQLTMPAAADAPTVVELVLLDDDADLAVELLARAAAATTGPLHWWAYADDAWSQQVAVTAGMRAVRDLHQMRVGLPLPVAASVSTRPYRPGVDDDEWLAVNNAAFAGHPEQGVWTMDDLHRRQAEPWFDPEGFRVHDIDGHIAAFCWTKVHPASIGEIYVIAVDPAHHGRGLGRALTLAGLDHLARQGITTGMLYVDGSNIAAVELYRSLGFTVHHTDRLYARARETS